MKIVIISLFMALSCNVAESWININSAASYCSSTTTKNVQKDSQSLWLLKKPSISQEQSQSTILYSTSTSSETTKTTITDDENNDTTIVKVQNLLQMARELGPVGIRRTEEEQERILNAALELKGLSKDKPTKVPLSGIHNLLYSAAPGGSSGKLGPIDGKVTQEFINDTIFINAVEIGPIKIALTANRDIKNDNIINVKFQKTTVTIFGIPIIEKEVGGGGAWKVLYADTIIDRDGTKKLVRIMQTPSLFIIEQPLLE